jgi:diacylglycerol kinase family enzyme
MDEITQETPERARKVLIAHNPKAGARARDQAVRRLCESLRADDFIVEVHTDIAAIEAVSRSALQAGELRAVVAAGGDGTLALVANRTPPGTPIVPLPLGTENLFARYLKIPANPRLLTKIIGQGRFRRFDVGAVQGKLFLLMLGCGLDAEVVRRVHAERTGHINHFSYTWPIVDALQGYNYPEVRVYLNDSSEPIQARWAFVANLPCYAAGLRLTPKARGTDGQLDLCAFRQGSLWNGLCYLSEVWLGCHEWSPDCVLARARRLRFEADAQVPFQIDGDPGGYLPATIDVLENRLTALVSPREQRCEYY